MNLKKAIFLLFLATSSLFSIGFDKTEHVQVSMALSYAGEALFDEYSHVSDTERVLYATGVTLAVGLGKEFYDQYDYGGFSSKDLVADLAGAVSGALLSSYLDKSYFLVIEHKKIKKATKIAIGRRF